MPDRSQRGSPVHRHELFRELLCAGTLIAAFVLSACLSWRTWPDVLVDFGQELYVPWRLAAGDVLYKDVAWVTGPLSQYANSLLFRLFGVSLTTLIAANLLLLAAIVAMLYYLFRQCGTRSSATCIGLFFLVVFAFGQYSLIGNYNYVCPYRHDITHGLALGLVNLLCLARFGRTRRKVWLVASGLCLGLLSLTKIEMTLAACLTTAVALPLFAWQKGHTVGVGPSAAGAANSDPVQRIGETVYWSGIVAAAALAPIAIAVAALSGPLGWTASFRQIFLQYRLALAPELSAGSGYYRAISGADHSADNLLTMAFAAVIVLAAVVAGYVVEMIFGGSKRANIWAAALGVAVTCCSLAFVPRDVWQALPACLPMLLAPVIVLTLRRALCTAEGSQTMLLLAAIYGIGLLPKILLRVAWSHYGFVLAMPGTLVLIHVALHTIPVWWNSHRQTGRCFQSVAAGLLTACALSLAWSWILIDLAKTVAVGEGGDLFYSVPDRDGRTLPTVNTLSYLRKHLGPQESLVVFPNGVMLNYLLRKRNPTPYIMFSPWESDVHGGEDLVADTIIQAAPDYAVIVTMDLTIHGRGNFGNPEFGGRIRKFLDQHYDVVDKQASEGGFGGPFVSTVFKRRSRPD